MGEQGLSSVTMTSSKHLEKIMFRTAQLWALAAAPSVSIEWPRQAASSRRTVGLDTSDRTKFRAYGFMHTYLS